MEVIGKLHAAAALLPGEKSSVPLEHQAGVPKPGGMFWKRKISFASAGYRKAISDSYGPYRN